MDAVLSENLYIKPLDKTRLRGFGAVSNTKLSPSFLVDAVYNTACKYSTFLRIIQIEEILLFNFTDGYIFERDGCLVILTID